MKIYLVIRNRTILFHTEEIEKVFDNEAKAKEYCKNRNDTDGDYFEKWEYKEMEIENE